MQASSALGNIGLDGSYQLSLNMTLEIILYIYTIKRVKRQVRE